jgi:predicted aspartyl protease
MKTLFGAAIAVGALVLSAAATSAASPAVDPYALFARYHAAVGGAAWDTTVGIRSAGVQTTGGVPSTFRQVLDHRTGDFRSVTKNGPVTDISGFDGVLWDTQGGPISEQTLPGLQEDNVTQAYISRDGWWNRKDPATLTMLPPSGDDARVRVVPAGGSVAEVWLSRTSGLIDKIVAYTDLAVVTTTIDDYRQVGGVVIPFHASIVTSQGITTDQVDTLNQPLRDVAAADLARPVVPYKGRIAGGGPSASVPFQFDFKSGWAYFTVGAGRGKATVIFDSGASLGLEPSTARRLGLRTSGGAAVTGVGNGSEMDAFFNVPVLSIGKVTLPDVNGLTSPLPYLFSHPRAGIESEGLVGAEFLQNFQTRFDFAASRWTAATFARPLAPQRNAVAVPFYSDGAGGPHCYVRATIDGVTGIFLIDTGNAGGLVIVRKFAQARGLFRGPGVRYYSPGGVGGGFPVDQYRAKTFTLGGVTLRDLPLVIPSTQSGAFASRTTAGNIGVRLLSRFGLTFDYARKTVSFAPSAWTNRPFALDRVGLSLTQPTADAAIVIGVTPGSPAESAGIHAKDRIVAIAGRSIAGGKLGIDDLLDYFSSPKPFTLTIQPKGGTPNTVTIRPRVMLGAAQ